jgi:hypothetical protein
MGGGPPPPIAGPCLSELIGLGGIQGLVSEIATNPELGPTYRERVVPPPR